MCSVDLLSGASCTQSLIWIFDPGFEAPVNHQLQVSRQRLSIHPGSRDSSSGSRKPLRQCQPTIREAIITSDVTTEWKSYCQLIMKKTESNMKLLLKELAFNDMLKTLFS